MAARIPVWFLAVVSSEQQADTLPHQRSWAEGEARKQGWRILRVFEGVASGKAGPRALVRELLAEVRSTEPGRRPQYVVMIRLDRLGRGSIIDAQVAVKDLADLGVGVWTRDMGEVKLDSAMSQLIAAAQLSVAAHENEVRVDKARDVYRQKRAAGKAIGNKRAYGLKIGPDGRDSPNGAAADVVRLAFRLRVEGAGYHVIGQRLSEVAVPHAFKNGESHTVRWTPTRVLRLLRNQAYRGVVVDDALFLKAQAVKDRLGPVRPQRAHAFPLSGSARCYCGRALTGLVSGSSRTPYYSCRASWNHDGSYRLVRADHLEPQFLDLLKRLRATPDLADRYRKSSAAGPMKMLKKALEEAEREIAGIDKRREAAWELHAAGKVRNEDLQERLDRLSRRRDELEVKVAETQERLAQAQAAQRQDRDANALFRRAPATYAKANDEERRTIVRAVALTLGGLCVEKDKKLTVRHVEDPGAQRKRSKRER